MIVVYFCHVSAPKQYLGIVQNIVNSFRNVSLDPPREPVDPCSTWGPQSISIKLEGWWVIGSIREWFYNVINSVWHVHFSCSNDVFKQKLIWKRMQVFFGIVCTFLIGFKPVSRIFSYKLINVLILKNIFIKCLIKKKNLPIYFQYDTWTMSNSLQSLTHFWICKGWSPSTTSFGIGKCICCMYLNRFI